MKGSKRNRYRRFLCLFLALATAFTMMPGGTLSAAGPQENGTAMMRTGYVRQWENGTAYTDTDRKDKPDGESVSDQEESADRKEPADGEETADGKKPADGEEPADSSIQLLRTDRTDDENGQDSGADDGQGTDDAPGDGVGFRRRYIPGADSCQHTAVADYGSSRFGRGTRSG